MPVFISPPRIMDRSIASISLHLRLPSARCCMRARRLNGSPSMKGPKVAKHMYPPHIPQWTLVSCFKKSLDYQTVWLFSSFEISLVGNVMSPGCDS